MRMRLVRALVWLLRLVAPSPVRLLSVFEDELLARAVELVKVWDGHDSSGEHKRHQVYAALLKEFPDENRRAVALAIEAALD